jgi:hypothetical protein
MGQVEQKPARIYLFLESACQQPGGQPLKRSYGMHLFVDEDARIPSRRVDGVNAVSPLTGFTCVFKFPASTTTTRRISGVQESARTRKNGPRRCTIRFVQPQLLQLIGKFIDAIEMLRY